MKYLKTYESHRKPLYNNGDIVLANSELYGFKNQMMRILMTFNAKENYYTAEFYDYPEEENYILMETDIIKKLESHEIEGITYNL